MGCVDDNEWWVCRDIMACFKVKYYPTIFQEGLRKATEILGSAANAG
jgi:hypothetical protein